MTYDAIPAEPALTHSHARFPLLACAVALALFSSPGRADAVQASGSLQLFPSESYVTGGDSFDLDVFAVNTSTDTPSSPVEEGTGGEGIDPVPALLSGPLVVELGCLDVSCTTQSTILRFVPGASNGCEAADPRVVSCTATGPQVSIALDPAGLPLPAGGRAYVATLRVQVDSLTGGSLPPLAIRATSPIGGLRACSSVFPGRCSLGEVAGATTIFFFIRPAVPCQSCKARIRFVGNAATPDKFEFEGEADVGGAVGSFDGTTRISVSLRDSVQSIFPLPVNLPTSRLQAKGQQLVYRNPKARTEGGIALVSLTPAGSMVRIRCEVFDRALAERAQRADMRLNLGIGAFVVIPDDPWRRRPFGWEAGQ